MAARAQVKPDFDGPEDRQLADDIARAMQHRPLMSRLAARRDRARRRRRRRRQVGDAPCTPAVGAGPRRDIAAAPASRSALARGSDRRPRPCRLAAAQRRMARQGAARTPPRAHAQCRGVGDDARHRRHHRRLSPSCCCAPERSDSRLRQKPLIEVERLARPPRGPWHRCCVAIQATCVPASVDVRERKSMPTVSPALAAIGDSSGK